MSSIPDFGGMLPKEFKKKSFGENEKLGIQKLFRLIVLGPSFSGKSNLAFHILKESPHVYSHLHVIARNPNQELCDYIKEKLQGFVTFYDPDAPPSVDAIKEIPNALQLVIIDDYSNDKKLQRDLFSHFFTSTCGRCDRLPNLRPSIHKNRLCCQAISKYHEILYIANSEIYA